MSDFTNQTSLDNLSSSLQIPAAATYRDYIANRIRPDYIRAYDYYIGNVLEAYNFRGMRFAECHSRAVFARHITSGLVRVLSNSCHLRFCPLCNDSRRRLIQRNIIDWLKNQKYPKFMTLTLKSSDTPLPDQINRLYKAFQALRRRNLLRKKVSSGVWFFQITKNKKTKLWHPHLHCLLTGSYVPRRELQRQWLSITEDSHQVDIRLIKDTESAALEVARYASCSVSIRNFDNFELKELDKALRRRRICGSWGKCKKQRLLSSPKYSGDDWVRLGSWSAVIDNIKNNTDAAEIFAAWKNQTTLTPGITVQYLEDNLNELLSTDEVDYDP